MNATTTQHAWDFTTDEAPRLRLQAHRADVRVVHDAAPGETRVELTSRMPVEVEPVQTRVSGREISVQVPPLIPPDGGEGFGIAFHLGRFMASVGNTAKLWLEVHLPPGADLDLQLDGGDIEIDGPAGEVTARTGGGDIRAEHLASASVHTGGGDVEVEDVDAGTVTTGGGDIRVGRIGAGRVRTGGGDVSIGRADGDLDASTGAGDVTIGRCAGTTEVSTSAGDVTADVASGSITVKTGTGDVTITVPDGVPVWQDLATVLGEARSKLTTRGEPAEGEPFIKVSARTGTGDITVRS
ncbi:MAG: DUF4097 family beta strand repeat protein [Propionibacteriaceae bacterium]|nr:DUF4097 family beta strand repeat protein [Propionibacteriaceae bacterium]